MYGLNACIWFHMLAFLIWWTWHCPTQKKSAIRLLCYSWQANSNKQCGVVEPCGHKSSDQERFMVLQAYEQSERTTDGGIKFTLSPKIKGGNFAHSLSQTVLTHVANSFHCYPSGFRWYFREANGTGRKQEKSCNIGLMRQT